MTTHCVKTRSPLSEDNPSRNMARSSPIAKFEMLDHCQKAGKVWVGLCDGHFVCWLGLIPPSFLSNQAYIWMWALESGPASVSSSFATRRSK